MNILQAMDKDPFNGSLKTDLKKKTGPHPNLVKYSPDVLKKKTNILDIIGTNKACFIKINVESSPQQTQNRSPTLEVMFSYLAFR